MNILQSIIMALQAVKANKLRSFLTLISIAIGVFSLIAVGSLIESLNSTVDDQLESLGETSIFIQKAPAMQFGNEWRKYARRKSITYSQFNDFKEQMELTKIMSAFSVSSGKTLKSGNKETDPNVSLMGADENYFTIMSDNLIAGRSLTLDDIRFKRNVIVIGNDVVIKLFPNGNALGKDITIGQQKFTVVGLLEPKGAMMGQSQDNRVIIPVTLFLKYYASQWDESLTIQMRAPTKALIDETMDEAIGILRTLRNVQPWEENDFEIESNEAIGDQFSSLTEYLVYFGWVTGGISLLAAGVGIMNIMLISVKERTKEIGVRKAVGAKSINIVIQFLIETITLAQLGGLIGIILGIVVGNIFGQMMGMELTLPFIWILIAVSICTFMGIIFGVYPAFKAAKLDPIDALRYE